MAEEIAPNGNGILSRLGKGSWLITLFAVIGGPVGSYVVFRQEVLVITAQQQLQIAQLEGEVKELKTKYEDIVPRREHDLRNTMQAQIDKLKDDRYEELKEEIRELRKAKQ